MKFASRQVKCGPTRSAVLGRLKMRARPSSASSRSRPSSRPARSIRTNAGFAPILELYPQTPHIMPGRSANAVRGIGGPCEEVSALRRIHLGLGQRCSNTAPAAPPSAARRLPAWSSQRVREMDRRIEPNLRSSARRRPLSRDPLIHPLRSEWSCGWLGRSCDSPDPEAEAPITTYDSSRPRTSSTRRPGPGRRCRARRR